MTPSAQQAAIVETLKAMLRERGLAYPAVAKHLGVSLATVKRTLRGANVSLETAAAIAELCGATLADVIDRVKQVSAIAFFDDAQDALFCKTPSMLHYFASLASGASPQQIEAKHALRPSSTVKYLAALEKVGLVEVGPMNRARLLLRPPFGFGRTSKYLARDLRARVDALVARVIGKLPSPERDLIVLKPLTLTADSYVAMARELREVVERYARASELERRDREAVHAIALVVCDVLDPPADAEIGDL